MTYRTRIGMVIGKAEYVRSSNALATSTLANLVDVTDATERSSSIDPQALRNLFSMSQPFRAATVIACVGLTLGSSSSRMQPGSGIR